MSLEIQALFVGRDLQVKMRLQLALEQYVAARGTAQVFAFVSWDELRAGLNRPLRARPLLVVDTASLEIPSDAMLHALAAWRVQHPLSRVVALRERGRPWPSWVPDLQPDFSLPRDLSVGRWQLALDRLLRPDLEVLLAAPVDPPVPPQPEWLAKREAEAQLRAALAEVRAKAILLWSLDNKPWARAGELPATLWGYTLRRLLALSRQRLYPERLMWAAPPEVPTPERFWIYIRPATQQLLLVMVGAGPLPYAALRQQAQAVIRALLTPPPHARLGRSPLLSLEEDALAEEEEPLPPEAFEPLFDDVPQPIPSLDEQAPRPTTAAPPPPVDGLPPPGG